MKKIFADISNERTEREVKNAFLSRKAAVSGMVLLENDGTLPLNKKGNIALFGAGGRLTLFGGTGSGDVNPRHTVSIEEALENASFNVTTKKWLSDYTEIYDNAEKEYADMIFRKAQESLTIFGQLFVNQFLKPAGRLISNEDIISSDTDTAIYVISRISGEGSDRKLIKGDYYLFDEEEENIRILKENYEKVIVVLNIGGVIDTKFLRNIGVSAVVLMYQAGMEGGSALIDLLLGKETFSGKLPDTWAENYEDYPSSKTFSLNDGETLDEFYEEGIYVGYRYFDSFNIKPAYPFGYGLSYTDFDIEFKSTKKNCDKIELVFNVKNIGEKYSGRETVQIYVSSSCENRPYQELKAFGKTKALAPSETEEIKISFDISSLASFNEEKAADIIEKGKYYIRYGNSSRNTHICACLEVEDDIVTEKLSNSCNVVKKFEELKVDVKNFYSYENEETEKEDAKLINVSSLQKSFKQEKAENKKAKEILDKLSLNEKIDLCVGEYKNALTVSPGAAGETLSGIDDLPPISMADGPAGLRLMREFYVSENGEVANFRNPIALPGARFLFPQSTKPEGYDTYYQYCTALPIGTLLASSFDKELYYDLGKLVSEEMEKYGVSLWLAPGMNIHRNPLCGRNFEYYSEDPVVTGVCASKISLGIQASGKTGVTLKHFAVNSQEEGRMSTNSNLSERALRDIYLKGFEIAVKEAKPYSIMTSYNLVNGYHSANNYDLLTTILRDEWGFNGFVMTDWGTTGNAIENKDDRSVSYAHLCVKCGNDMTMPGSREDFNDIKNALDNGIISLEDIEKCAQRIIESIIRVNN